ncbi:class I SAM-dependent methyltransferase [Pontibacter indicus]|nr:methyltransferase domain-containing protein [Pontibacter indicus]
MREEIYTKENSDYFLKNPTWHVEDSPWKAVQIFKMLQRHKLNIKTIAEIGCGAGEILNQLHLLMGREVAFTGYDISADAIKLAKPREKERLKFEHENLLTVHSKFDLLLMMDVFEHVDDYLNFLKQCKGKAEYSIFHIPLDISAQSVLRNKLMHWRNSLGHLHFFTKETAIATLQDAGYDIIDFFYTAGSVELADNSIKSKFASALRSTLFKINQDITVKSLGGYSLLVLAK